MQYVNQNSEGENLNYEMLSWSCNFEFVTILGVFSFLTYILAILKRKVILPPPPLQYFRALDSFIKWKINCIQMDCLIPKTPAKLYMCTCISLNENLKESFV